MICPNCGKEYNEKMTCCISCGADLVPFERDTEQTVIEAASEEALPLIPERTAEEEPLPEAAQEGTGFVRKLESRAEEQIIPIKTYSRSTALTGAVKFTGSLITTVTMLLLIIASVGAMVLRLITDERNISEFADRLDIMALPVEQNGTQTIQDAIYTMSLGTGLSRDDIRIIYEESTMKDFLAAQLSEYGEFIRSGNAPEKLTPEQIKQLFRENVSVIDSTMGYALNEHDIELACSEIDRAEPLLEVISAENMEKTIGGNTLTALRLYGSVPAIAVTTALAASMFAVLGAINKKSTRVLSWGGGAILTGGAAVLAATFLFSIQLPYSSSDRLVRTIVKCTCDVISPDLYRIGGTLAVMGIVLLIWAESLRRSAKR